MLHREFDSGLKSAWGQGGHFAGSNRGRPRRFMSHLVTGRMCYPSAIEIRVVFAGAGYAAARPHHAYWRSGGVTVSRPCPASRAYAARRRDPASGGRRCGVSVLARRVPAGLCATGLDHRPQSTRRYHWATPIPRTSANRRRNWLLSRRTLSLLPAPRPWGRCCKPHAQSRSYSRSVVDPVGAGFVDSLARPGGNATGFLLYEYSLGGKGSNCLNASRPA